MESSRRLSENADHNLARGRGRARGFVHSRWARRRASSVGRPAGVKPAQAVAAGMEMNTEPHNELGLASCRFCGSLDVAP